MSQSLELNQRHHVMHLLLEVDCGPKAWTVLKELHAPTSVVATLMMERELADQVLEDAITAAGIVASIHEQIEPPAELELVDARVGADEDSGGGLPSPPTEGWRRQQQRLRDAREPTWQRTWLWWCWTRCKERRRLQRPTRRYRLGSRCEIWTWGASRDDGARRNQKNGANMVADSSDNNPKSNGGAEKKKERTAGQFFHIGEQGEQGDASAKVGAGLHPLNDWMQQITMQLDLTPSVWEEGEEAAAESGDGEKVQEASAGGGDDVETSGSTKEAAGSEGGEQQLGKAKPETKVSEQMEQITMQLDQTPSVWEEGEEAATVEAPAGGGDDVETTGSTKEAAGSEGGEQQLGKANLTAGADVAEQQLGNEEALLILPHGYNPDEEDEPAYCFLAPAPEEPASMEEALAGQDREKWLVSRDAEYQSLLENGTWDLVVLPEGKKAVQCKWVLRIKTDDKGQVTIYKSRLVAKGFMQKEKQDFNEIFAPTAKPATLRVLWQMQPVCKLKKSIYGLKQAPHCWYQKLAAVLEMGFRTCSCDESLFLKGEGEKLVKYYLGMHVERDMDHRSLKLHQEKFIKELGEKYGIENERKVATPLPAEFKLVKAAEDEGVEAEEQQQFQSLVGSLLYAAVHTRPDISFSVGQLARVVQNPSEEQVDAAERVVKYLNSHPSIGVQSSASAQVKQKGVEVLKEKGERLGEGKLFLTCFTDATWAYEKVDYSSMGGYICVVGGGPVSWRSKKQTETALSSVESEYMAMFHGVKEVIWLRMLLEEIG
ncbi:unnamed protein product [Closterium sp. NIES-54]